LLANNRPTAFLFTVYLHPKSGADVVIGVGNIFASCFYNAVFVDVYSFTVVGDSPQPPGASPRCRGISNRRTFSGIFACQILLNLIQTEQEYPVLCVVFGRSNYITLFIGKCCVYKFSVQPFTKRAILPGNLALTPVETSFAYALAA